VFQGLRDSGFIMCSLHNMQENNTLSDHHARPQI